MSLVAQGLGRILNIFIVFFRQAQLKKWKQMLKIQIFWTNVLYKNISNHTVGPEFYNPRRILASMPLSSNLSGDDVFEFDTEELYR